MTEQTLNPDAPTMEPAEAQTGQSDAAEPAMLPENLLAQFADTKAPAPTLIPPGEEAMAAAEEGITAWHTGKKITALWSNDQNRNSWIAVPGMGWKRLAHTNASALVNMTMLAACAEQTNATVNLRIASDGMVHEIYVW